MNARGRRIAGWVGVGLVLVLLGACGPAPQAATPTPRPPAILPTRIPPTEGPSPTPVPSLTPTPSETPSPTLTDTPSPTSTLTETPIPSETPLPSETPTPTATLPPSALNQPFAVVLRWDATSNLDLGVQDPAGAMLTSLQATSPSGGAFSGDANASCATAQPDASEQVVWPVGTAPAGRYQVVVRYQAACGNEGVLPATLAWTLGDVTLAEQPLELTLGQQYELNFTFDQTSVVLELPFTPDVISVSYGQTMEGTLDDANYEVHYVFDGQAGDVIAAGLQRNSGDLDAYLRLLDSTGAELTANDDARSGDADTDARIENFSLPADDTYTLIATRFQGEMGTSSGAYSLDLERLVSGAELAVGGGVLAYGSTARGLLDDDRPSMTYTFFGTRSDVVSAAIHPLSGDLDANLTLLDAQGRAIAFNERAGDDPASPDARLDHVLLPGTGMYTLQAGRFQGAGGFSSGVFELNLTLDGTDPALASDANRVLAYGDVVEGEITNDQPRQAYPFFGAQAEIVTIALSQRSGDLDTLLILRDADGVEIARNDDAAEATTSTDSRIERFRLPETGLYFVIATRFQEAQGASTGTFELTVEQAEPLPEPTAAPTRPTITYGATVQGVIDDATPRVEYDFVGNAADVIDVHLRRVDPGETLDTVLYLLDANGNQLAGNDDAPAGASENATDSIIVGFRLPESGTYTLVATRFQEAQGESTGTFSLSLDVHVAAQPGTVLDIPLVADNSGSLSSNGRPFAQLFPGDDVRGTAYQAFLTFTLPEDITAETLDRVELLLGECTTNGQPFVGLGGLGVQAYAYGQLDRADYGEPDPEAVLGYVESCPAAPLDVTEAVRAVLARGETNVQFRLAFLGQAANGAIDDVTFSAPQLAVRVGSS